MLEWHAETPELTALPSCSFRWAARHATILWTVPAGRATLHARCGVSPNGRGTVHDSRYDVKPIK
jgi:hypothetical protein